MVFVENVMANMAQFKIIKNSEAIPARYLHLHNSISHPAVYYSNIH
jgi:hypothetical protein